MPIILGHEFSGEVVEIGPAVTGVKIGDKVVCNPVLGCGECSWCRKGVPCLCEKMACIGLQRDRGFAEYAVIPEDNCFVLPVDTAMDEITVIEPCATAIRNLKRGQIKIGDNLLIIGAGTVGLLTIQAARLSGCNRIIAIEPNAYRAEVALKTGADAVFSPFEEELHQKILNATGGRGVNAAIECTGKSDSPALALDVIEKGGNIVLVGICPEPSPMLTRNIARGEINLFGVHGYVREDLCDAIAFVQSGRIDVKPLITGRIGLDEIVDNGLEKLGPNCDNDIKIIVDMTVK